MERENTQLQFKLTELDKQYQLLKTRLTMAQHKSRERLLLEIEDLKNEIIENSLMLQEAVQYSRSPALAKLASLQLGYCSDMESLRRELYRYMGETTQEKSEAFALYAEYAIDFAIQADRFALLAALEAIHIQNEEMEEHT